jgi:hypothetical protein
MKSVAGVRARITAAAVIGVLVAVAAGPAAGAATVPKGASTPPMTAVAGYQVPLVVGPSPVAPTSVPTPPVLAGSDGLRAAATTITVTYDAGFNANPAAKAAFQAAVDVWKAKLTTTVPIVIDASFTALPSGVLGSAGPTALIRNFTGAPTTNTFYPIATANALAGSDLLPGEADIVAHFSSAWPTFYFGTDGHPGSNIDFMSVVLHEIGHGLGFLGTMQVSGGLGQYGLGTGSPAVYDKFVKSNGTAITSIANTSAAMASAVLGTTLTFDGTNAKAANAGAAPRLYAPASWQQGSSYSHLDEATYPAGNVNSLMTPQIGYNESIHDPGPITLGMFKDLGWKVVAPVVPKVSIGGSQVVEGATGTRAARFTVALSQPTTVPVTVAYATAPGTATATTDYTSKSGTVTIPANATSTTVSVLLKGDATVEPNETYSVKLSAPVNATLGRATGSGLIINDDASSGLRLAIGNATIDEGKSGNRALRFTVTLSGASASAVSVQWATAPGTATATSDYATGSGTVTIAAGSTSNVVSVNIKGDAVVEGNETFTVKLTGPTGGAILHKATGTGTILNDD